MQKEIKLHAIILALNEEMFLKAQLDTIYPFCSAISIITQYDRDWYGKPVTPDSTVPVILNYPDPDGKINLVIRRLPDEAAARNMEMLSYNTRSFKNTKTHGREWADIKKFHSAPDYFWVIDADELYDIETIPAVINYLKEKNPRGMRVTGYNYLRTWNNRIPRDIIDFTHFGFIQPGILFEQRRIVSWNESRLSKLLKTIKLPDLSAKMFGFITCPESVGVFHHACWLGDNDRIYNKLNKSSHSESKDWKMSAIDAFKTVFIPTDKLPLNIQKAQWPENFYDRPR